MVCFTSTGSRPVVQDKCFSQPIFCFEPAINSGPQMSESNGVPNISPTQVSRAILMHPFYARDSPKHPTQKFDHHQIRDTAFISSPPVSVLYYIAGIRLSSTSFV